MGVKASREDEPSRWLRRSLVRYLCLTQVLVFRDISVPVRRRFPTLESLIDAGILLEEEKEKLDAIKLRYNKYWAPIRWIQAIALQARKEEKIYADLMYSKLCDEINRFRYSLQLLCNYDWVPLPLVYSQPDLVLPVMTMIQFLFFIGWLKTSLCIADNYDRVPEVQPDRFWRCRNLPPPSSEMPLVGSAVNAKYQFFCDFAHLRLCVCVSVSVFASYHP
ncbi:unnamed protein product [Gongylonema pulchrum]|uniref:Bestrophin homolog n=1 Tax=Gongylonema pulchrum TaxID=637853 RepID=A0A183E4I3_9BILA|nr:unnamed protein product [Gongylonema pulchrum]